MKNSGEHAGLARWAWLLVLIPAMSFAQSTASPNGIKVGEGRIHPFLDLELRFDSAATLAPLTSGGPMALRPEFLTHLRPGIRLDLPGETVALNLNGNIDYVWYTGLVTPGTQYASRLEGGLDLDALFNPKGQISFQIGDVFTRSDRSTNPALGVGVISLFNEARASLPINPGRGALEITPGARWAVEFFDAISPGGAADCGVASALCDPSQVSALNYSNVGFDLDARYRFLPKTALVLDAAYDMRSYTGATSPPANLLNASLGLSGLLSQRIAVLAKAGWAQNFAGAVAGTLIGHLEVSYLASQTASVRVGYMRSLQPVAVYGLFGDDRGYLEGRAMFGGRLTLRAYAAFDYLTFYAAPRNDTVLTVDMGPEYQFTPWLVGSVGYVLGVRGASGTTATTLNYVRNEGYLRVSLQY